MDHTLIVTVTDLEDYAETTESERTIPELIYSLVRESPSGISICRIPYGEAINQSGLDGLVVSESAFLEFIPAGRSFWEIGTGADPQRKATRDFTKRTKTTSTEERAEATFVFVTPRCRNADGWTEQSQRQWLKKRKNSGWKELRILDGVKLADWLRVYPAIGRRMWKTMGRTKSLAGFFTPTEHWEILQSLAGSETKLPAKIFTVGRESACTALHRLFEGEAKKQIFFAESPRDVEDFVAGFLSSLEEQTRRSYSDKCLFVKDEDVWHSLVAAKTPHVLVAHPRLAVETDETRLLAIAERHGHSVIVSVCDTWAGGNREIIRLRSPSQSILESTLHEAGFPLIRARELASIGGGRLSALIRHLSGFGDLPPYATWENARILAQASLIGRWDGNNEHDRAAIEILLGKGYGEWIEMVRIEASRADTPLVQSNESWKMLSRGESWSALGPRITDEDLDRFRKLAVNVLGERNPSFELPKEERFAASIYGKKPRFSGTLKEGIAESLALLGSRGDSLTLSCSHRKGEVTALLAVRELLENADWQRWAALNHFLPNLAEAAPDEFLEAVETGLDSADTSPFRQVFSQEGPAGGMGTTYTSGLLWALETLAWKEDHLARVTIILGNLAAIDPGGNWSNRPSNSLADIFLPWHLQTCASLPKRRAAIDALLRKQPAVGWKLILALLPKNHGFTSGCHRPTWREFIPRDWDEHVTIAEYWEQVDIYAELAIQIAKREIAKLIELIDRLRDLSPRSRDHILEHLTSPEVVGLNEEDRFRLWDALTDVITKHRRFAHAEWAMPSSEVDKIEKTSLALSPESPFYRFQRIFTEREFDLYDENVDFDEQREKLESKRQGAVRELLDTEGLNAVIAFALKVESPSKVGHSLARVLGERDEQVLLPSFIENEDATTCRFISGFVWSRFWLKGWPWVDVHLSANWSRTQKAKFFLLLPFTHEAWTRVELHLGDANSLYWNKIQTDAWAPTEHLQTAVEKLINHKRSDAAVKLLGRATRNGELETATVTGALLALLTESELKEFDVHSTQDLIGWLQKQGDRDRDALFKIEWNFLPLLDEFSGERPRTLEACLATDPKFFCDLIALIFKSRKEPKDQPEQPTEQQRNLAKNAYRLLHNWRIIPGTQEDGTFNPEAFTSWVAAVKDLANESGHYEVAMSQIGQVLLFAPADDNGLWIHSTVADALDSSDAKKMRSGFRTRMFNQRGVHGFSGGKEEHELAQQAFERAEALEVKGFIAFATAMREFGESYLREAKRQESLDPLDD